MLNKFIKHIITNQVDNLFSGKAMKQFMQNDEFDRMLAKLEKESPNDPRIAQMKKLKEVVEHDTSRVDLTKATFYVKNKQGVHLPVSGERMRQIILIGAFVFFGVVYFFFSL